MRTLPSLGLLVLALAGCAGPIVPPGDPGDASATLPGGWARVCSISNWADPCTAKGTQTSGPANELMLAVNPTDPSNVVVGAKDYHPEGSDCVWAGTSVTNDAGATWTNGWVGGARGDRDPRVAAYDCVTDPVLEFGPDGTLYYLVEAYNAGRGASGALPDPTGLAGFGAGSQMWLAASLDGGSTWAFRGPITVGPGGAVLLHDKSDLAVSPVTGTLVASWTAFNAVASQLVYARSTDGGATFSAPRPLMQFGAPTDAQQPTAMVDLEGDAEGVLHAAWFNWETGDVLHASSADDGATFGAPAVVAPAHPWTGQDAPNSRFRIFDSTMLAVDRTDGPRRGWLYLAWADDFVREGDHDVRLTRSEDGGATWTEPARAGSFDGDLGIHQSGVPFMGDYNGIGAAGPHVYLAYADTREGRSDVAVARFTRG